tara:strand:+ start:2310 stop:2795 length:486 start_codon:yes stop_codon:yes gene_type:complete
MMIEIKKKNQRKIAIKKREELFLKRQGISQNIIRHLEKFDSFKKTNIIASFISMRTEISTQKINHFILNNGKRLCLPTINNNKKELIFKEYNYKSKLVTGKYGTKEPNENNKNLLPEIILTPCLAFDMKGYRLGYGGGYYDKTFDYYEKNNHNFISIVVAY